MSFLNHGINRIIAADSAASFRLNGLNLYRETCIWVEWMIHGFPWLVTSSLSLIVSYGRDWSPTTQHALLILNIGLLFDIIMVGVLKSIFVRKRPIISEGHLMEVYTVDAYSFPSGHTSRAFMLATFLYHCSPTLFILLCWMPIVVALSRVALGRHYFSDVLAGAALGVLEGRLLLLIPLAVNTWFRNILK